ncbi:DUF1189 family protein [Candidatus Tisiphia endosymbiont of Nemotelus uliginosus]|uniref:DUF1189 family protein n=1 Tax=Candidatus Tisiphia endosymbiont of Nemotelus uliginosus TaxID=3077926 RepID=UPI0035C93B97
MTAKLLIAFLWIKTLFSQLWLSISSIRFYQDVYKFYHGYGTKYLFTISFLSSLIYCFFILHHLFTLKDYFTENLVTKNVATIDYILKQLPEIYYDGHKIVVDQNEPIYLLDPNGNRIAVIDSRNQLSHGEKLSTPIIFSSNNITISTIEMTDHKKSNVSIEYSKLLNRKAQTLTAEVVKQYCAKIVDSAPKIFIYLITPLIIIVGFCFILFEKSFTILLVYILTNFFGLKSSMQVCSRVVLFASGVSLLLQPLIVLFLPALNGMIFYIQMFAHLLLFLGLLRIRNNNHAVL